MIKAGLIEALTSDSASDSRRVFPALIKAGLIEAYRRGGEIAVDREFPALIKAGLIEASSLAADRPIMPNFRP